MTTTTTETRKCLCCERVKASYRWYPVNDSRTLKQVAWQCEECNDRIGSLE